jgi:hypothetical protein
MVRAALFALCFALAVNFAIGSMKEHFDSPDTESIAEMQRLIDKEKQNLKPKPFYTKLRQGHFIRVKRGSKDDITVYATNRPVGAYYQLRGKKRLCHGGSEYRCFDGEWQREK